MESVIQALADAIFPSINAANDGSSVSTYKSTSGADQPQVVPHVLNIIDTQLYGLAQTKLRLLLWIMAYRLPMLLLAGRHCLSSSWPFVLSLPEMPVAQRAAMLRDWAGSTLPALRQAYKGIKAILAAVLFSFIDPSTGTNPFFKAIGYEPGTKVQDTKVGPPPPGAADQEELIASAHIHMPQVLQVMTKPAAVQAYLTKRGFNTVPSDTAPANGHAVQHGEGSAYPGSSTPTIHLHYDAVIVGSGAGGGVTAAVLAAAGLRVLVLEKSAWTRSKDMSWLEGDAFEQMYERAGFMSTEDGALVVLAGSTLGGGTKINWAGAIRPPQHVRDEWATTCGLDHLGPDSAAFDSALDTVCSRLGVSTGTALSAPNLKLREGMKALGEHVEEYPRVCQSKTCSAYCNMGCRSGHKQSSEVWLCDAVRAGAHVLTGVSAQQVMTQPCEEAVHADRMRATGVLASLSSGPTGQTSSKALQLLIHAPVVVSSCGAIHTPALLLRSGITVGGNVGTNLRLHPATGVNGVFERTPEQAAAGRGAVDMHKGVPMGVFSRAAANWEAGGYGAFLSVPAAQPGMVAAGLPDQHLGALKETMLEWQDASLVVLFARDSSGGRVRIDSEGRPVVSYWPCDTTRKHMMEGMILAARALHAAGAIRVTVPHAVEPWDITFNPNDPTEVQQQQLEALFSRMREVGVQKFDLPLFSAHQTGSCRMGVSQRDSACDPSGEVWGVSGLYVADGSTFPTALGVNTMVTIYATSYLTAQGIARRWKKQRPNGQLEACIQVACGVELPVGRRKV